MKNSLFEDFSEYPETNMNKLKRMKLFLVMIFLFTFLFASAADMVVSGIPAPYTAANGTYISQGVLARSGYTYYKHSTQNYYLYYDKYNNTPGWEYWNIDDDTDDEVGIMYCSDAGVSGISPTGLTFYLGSDGVTVVPSISVAEYSAVPEINITGNNTTIASGDNSPSFSDFTKFGSAQSGLGSMSRTFTIQNTGNLALTVGAINITGPNATDFSVSVSPSSSVSSSGSTTFTITFAPTDIGDRNATISIVNNDANENPYTFSLSGYGFSPMALVVSGSTTPSDANGSYVFQGIKNEFQYWKHSSLDYYILYYSSNKTWAIDNNFLTADGYPFYCFTESNAPTGLSWSTLSYMPTGGSSYVSGAGTISITAETPAPEINIKVGALSINDGSTTIGFSRNTNFGTLNASSGSVTKSFTIENNGTSDLILSGVSPYVSLTGADVANFTVTKAPSTTIGVSGSTTFEVTFDPVSAGTKNITLVITSNDADEGTYNFDIQGTGITPKNIVVSNVTTPSNLNGTFIYQGISNEFQYWKHSSESYYIYNYKQSSLYDPTWYIDSDMNATSYNYKSVSGSSAASAVDVTGWSAESGNVGIPNITYSAAEIDIQNSDNISILDGETTPSVFDSTDFGYAISSENIWRTFFIKNVGTETLNLTGIPYVSISGTNAANFSVVTAPSASIAPGGTSYFVIHFTPSFTGLHGATISIGNSDENENPYNFNIQAHGAEMPTLTTSAASNIGVTSITGNGNITALGSPNPIDHGICWGTSSNPTIYNNKVDKGAASSTGAYSANITGLNGATTYHARAYATNVKGTVYGNDITFTTLNTVNSIVRNGSEKTKTNPVIWTVNFAHAVSGLTVSNFSLNSSGLSGTSISSVTGSGTTWTVTADIGSGSGTLRLDMTNATGLNAGFSNAPFAGEVYNIDKTSPEVTNVDLPLDSTYKEGQNLIFKVNFNEKVKVTGGTPVISITMNTGIYQAVYQSGSGSNSLEFKYTVLSNCEDVDGFIMATSINENGAFITDSLGNSANLTLNNVGNTTGILVDGIKPEIFITTTASDTTNISPIELIIIASEDITGFDFNDIEVINGVKSTFSGSGKNYFASIIPFTQGPVFITIPDSVAEDAAGNFNSPAFPLTVVFDNMTNIKSISPVSGPIGTTVTIYGDNFSDIPFNNKVFFGGVKAIVTEATAKTLKVRVPPYSGSIVPITVEVSGQVASSSNCSTPFFTITNTPNISLIYSSGSFGSGIPSYGLNSGDFDNNGIADLLIANSDSNVVGIAIGIGDGTFNEIDYYTVGTKPSEAKTTDLNTDGNLDIIAVNTASNNVSVLLGIGDGTFATASNYSVGTEPYMLTVADFNGDNKTDVAVTNSGLNTISILLGDGTGAFGIASDVVVGANPVGIVSGDFNSDMIIDLAVSNADFLNSSSNSTVSILLGVGNGTFNLTSNYVVGKLPEGVSISDFNMDSKADIVVVNSMSNDINVLLGNGNGTFTNATIPVGKYPILATVGDYNGDNKPDMAISNTNDNNISILIGKGDGTFNALENFPVGNKPYISLAGDFNGDGKADIAVANYNDENVTIMLNSTPTIWNGTTWSMGEPDKNSHAIINGTYNNSGFTCKSLIINASKQVTITGTLEVKSDLTLKSDVTGTASLINKGTLIVGRTVFAENYMTGNAWHIVAPIAENANASTFIQNSNNAIPFKEISGTIYFGMMDYNEAGNIWNNYFNAVTTEILNIGKGYSLRRSSDGLITWEGSIITGSKTINLTKSGEGWNCIGNPYTSAINMNTSADAVNNFLTVNSGSLDPSYACAYLWDDASLKYKILGNVNYGTRDLGQNFVQAGQGFFVKAKDGSSSVQFTADMQTHQTGISLFKSAKLKWPSVELNAISGTANSSTYIMFNNSMSKGLDVTYDAGLLRGKSGLNFYSKLIEDNGVDFAIQCLPEDYTGLLIPIGIELDKGGEVTFSAEMNDLPANLNWVLEDRKNGEIIDLNNGASYTSYVNQIDTGRFFLKTILAILNVNKLEDTNITVFSDNKLIYIKGLLKQGKADLFDINGRCLGSYSISRNEEIIDAKSFASGIYMLKVKTENQIRSYKIFLN